MNLGKKITEEGKEFFHLDNGGTERAFAMTKMAYPDWIIEE